MTQVFSCHLRVSNQGPCVLEPNPNAQDLIQRPIRGGPPVQHAGHVHGTVRGTLLIRKGQNSVSRSTNHHLSGFTAPGYRSPGVFPTVPPRDVANALRAGLLLFLERMLRRGYRELAARAGQPDRRVVSVLSQALLQSRQDWGWLLAYGDPQQVAPLMRTCAQLLRRLVEQREADRCAWT